MRMHAPRTAAFAASIVILFAALASPADATIINIPDATGQTGNYTINNPIAAVSGEDSVYIVGAMTFTNAIDTSSAFDVAEVNAGGNTTAYQWGHAYNSDEFWHVNPGPNAVLDADITVNESHLIVLKIDQTTGNYSLFFNPNLALSEAFNSSYFDRTGGPTGSITAIQFRGGDSSTNTVDYTGFAVYTGDDTPFASPIPAPAALPAGLALMAAIRARRRRR